ncbi:MAG TPA: hypothetical protein VE620_12925 [Myxococcales bacterium]|jgi:hypothetical protein|nr:hypothetical protein [Myxococcales bacterium]
MPLPELSRQEVRLGRFAALCSAAYAVTGIVFALFPRWTFGELGRARAELTAEVRFWQVLGVGMMVTVSVACALVAHSPRERRVALLPVLGGKLTTSVLALAVLVASGPDGWARPGFRAVFAVFAADFPLFAVSAWLFHSAAPGVHLSAAPTQSSPELPAPPKPVRLTVGGKKT